MQVWCGAQSLSHHPHSDPADGSSSPGEQWLCVYDLRKKFTTFEEAERFRQRTQVHIPQWPESGPYTYLYSRNLRYLAGEEYPKTDIHGLAQGLLRQSVSRAVNERDKVLQVLPSDEDQERRRAAKAKAKAVAKAKVDAKANALQNVRRT